MMTRLSRILFEFLWIWDIIICCRNLIYCYWLREMVGFLCARGFLGEIVGFFGSGKLPRMTTLSRNLFEFLWIWDIIILL